MEEIATCAKITQVHNEGGRLVSRAQKFYNLDMLLSAASDDSSLTPEYKIWPAAGTEEWDVPNPGKSIVGYFVSIPAGRECTISVSLRTQNP